MCAAHDDVMEKRDRERVRDREEKQRRRQKGVPNRQQSHTQYTRKRERNGRRRGTDGAEEFTQKHGKNWKEDEEQTHITDTGAGKERHG